jgi:uncharacterized protein (DUF1501 family)
MSQSKIIPFAPCVHSGASRRIFLRQASALSLVAGAGAPIALNLLGVGSAVAQSASDYRAVVCLFMNGGNDGYNMVLPTDSQSWSAYTTVRNQTPDSIALLSAGTAPNLSAAAGSPERLGGVLPITPANAQGRTYALHPMMGTLQTMFNTEKRLAIVPAIGPLIVPTTKAQFELPSYPRPGRLASHNDQQISWMAMSNEGATSGWGGRMADRLVAGNTNAVFTAISVSGNEVWLSGQTVRQYRVGAEGAVALGVDANEQVFGSSSIAAALQRISSRARSSHVFEADLAAIAKRSIEAEAVLRTALPLASDSAFGTPPASGSYTPENDPKLQIVHPIKGDIILNPLAQQLQMVARLVQAGMSGKTGVRRQVFFVNMGGFDTHSNQNSAHTLLMAQLAHGMRYFDTALGNIKALNQVTTFTASDFGRSFTSNGDGTDHGWGSHHFVMGGAVRGGNLYGTFPAPYATNANFRNHPDHLGNNGALLPTTSVDQLGATLARWFGLSDAQSLEVFPNLGNFNVSVRNLGFLS